MFLPTDLLHIKNGVILYVHLSADVSVGEHTVFIQVLEVPYSAAISKLFFFTHFYTSTDPSDCHHLQTQKGSELRGKDTKSKFQAA